MDAIRKMRFDIFLSIVAIAAAWPTFPPAFAPHEFTAVVPNASAEDIAVTPKTGWVHIVGSTIESDYPTTADAFDRTCGTDGACNPTPGIFGPVRHADVVLTLLDSAGQIRYSTYLGGSELDELPRIALAPDGTVWLTGLTFSPAFEGYAGSCGGVSGSFWIAHFDYALKKLKELRCYPWLFAPTDTEVDAQGRLWVIGTMGTANAATSNAYQRQLAGINDIFVARFAAGEANPQYATYLGGRSFEDAGGLAIAPSGAVAITGRTNSQDFPVVRAFKSTLVETSPVFGDAFVAMLDPGGQLLQFSTYWGGSADEAGSGVGTDANGNVYVTGYSRSAEMPVTAGAFRPRCEAEGGFSCFDAFITKFSSTGTLLASTFFGGIGTDRGRAVYPTPNGRVIALGSTQSRDFPVVNASPSPRTPAVNAEQVYLTVFNDSLSAPIKSGFVLDQRYLPNIGVLAVRDGFAFVAGQVTPSQGLPAGVFGAYIRAMRLP